MRRCPQNETAIALRLIACAAKTLLRQPCLLVDGEPVRTLPTGSSLEPGVCNTVHSLSLHQSQLLTLLLSGHITRDVDLVACPWHRYRWRLEAKGEVAAPVSGHRPRQDILIDPNESTERIGSLNADVQWDIGGATASDFDRPLGYFSHVLRRSDFD